MKHEISWSSSTSFRAGMATKPVSHANSIYTNSQFEFRAWQNLYINQKVEIQNFYYFNAFFFMCIEESKKKKKIYRHRMWSTILPYISHEFLAEYVQRQNL